MMREYFIRGQRKTVEEIDDVVAVQVAANARGQRMAGHAAFGAEAQAQDTGMDAETASAFADARWLFVRPSQATRNAKAAAAPLPNADVVGSLVKRPSGRYGVATKLLNVQLQENLSGASGHAGAVGSRARTPQSPALRTEPVRGGCDAARCARRVGRSQQ